MTADGPDSADAAVEALSAMLESFEPRNFAVHFWNGKTVAPSAGLTAEFTIGLKTPTTLDSLLSQNNLLNAGQAYIGGTLDIEGNIEAAIALVNGLQTSGLFSALGASADQGSLAPGFGSMTPGPDRSASERTKTEVNYHYDLPLDFWRLWLDKRLVYTCAYFSHPAQSLDSAQIGKLDHICKKLRLKPGSRLLDVGCGWGALTVHAARNYGAQVLGVTLSNEQADWARQCIAEAGLEKLARIEVCDFREIPPGPGFDKIAAIGIVEHVGDKSHLEFFKILHDRLVPGGLLLVQGITNTPLTPAAGAADFVNEYIFPGASLAHLSVMLTNVEKASLEIRDVESLREHYVLTLRHWLRSLETQAEPIRRLVTDTRYRAFRAYLAGFAFEMERGGLSVFQTLLSRPGSHDLPLTRAHLYAGERAP